MQEEIIPLTLFSADRQAYVNLGGEGISTKVTRSTGSNFIQMNTSI